MTSLLLIGCGNMSGALLKGWMASPFGQACSRVDVVKPSQPTTELQLEGVRFYTSLDAITHTPTLVIWGVKPHQLETVVPQSIAALGDAPVYISIAAGKTLAGLSAYAGANTKIVRAMPNTPVAAGVGITGLCAAPHVSTPEQQLVQECFSSVGKALWVEEVQMNALTALCGSGPAYVFYFMECLAKAATDLGLDAADADALSRQMVLGAGHLATSSEEPLAALRQNVTSPNGTTAAALDIWMQQGTLDTQAQQALSAAVRRAKELEK